jgi:hypothetical protein
MVARSPSATNCSPERLAKLREANAIVKNSWQFKVCVAMAPSSRSSSCVWQQKLHFRSNCSNVHTLLLNTATVHVCCRACMLPCLLHTAVLSAMHAHIDL